MKSKRYPGALGRGWRKPPHLPYALRGLDLLAEHYGIEDKDPVVRFMTLALCLARDHVPYFQQAGKRGPKKDTRRMVLLEFDIALARRQVGQRSERAALEFLTHRQKPWIGLDADSLARRLREHRVEEETLSRFVRALPAVTRGPGGVELLREMRRSLAAR